MLNIYVPSSHSTGAWIQWTSTPRNNSAWTLTSPGSIFSYGDVCSADYRSDINIVSTTGLMGERLTYTFLPFIIKNNFAAPHTHLYDVGFSAPILNPSTRSTGLDSQGNPSQAPNNFSTNSQLDASYSNGNFESYENSNFGFQVLGISNDESIWDLQDTTHWITSQAFEHINTRLSLPPQKIALAMSYTTQTGVGDDFPISKTNSSLGYYTTYKYIAEEDGNTYMKLIGTLSYPPSNNGALKLDRGAYLWGFFYFLITDTTDMTLDKNMAEACYETNLVTTGSPSNPNYYYPAYSDFKISQHGKWTVTELNDPPARTRTTWFGDLTCRESRTGWFVAGRRVD